MPTYRKVLPYLSPVVLGRDLLGNGIFCGDGFSTTKGAENTEGGEDGEDPKEQGLPSHLGLGRTWIGEKGRGFLDRIGRINKMCGNGVDGGRFVRSVGV